MIINYLLLLLRKGACCICDAFYGGDSLYEGLVGHTWSLITLTELEGSTRFVDREVVCC